MGFNSKILSFRRHKTQSSPTERVDHATTLAADPYSYRTAHARLLIQFRFLMAAFLIMGIALIASINLISTLIPLKKTEYVLVRDDPESHRLYRIEPIEEGVDGHDLAFERIAEFFVKNLLEIDTLGQRARFSKVEPLMSAKFFKKFKRLRVDTGEIDDLLKSGLNRTITITDARKQEEFNGIYKYTVDYIKTDKRDGKIIEKSPGRVWLQMTKAKQKVRSHDIYENPLGIFIVDMSIKDEEAQ